MPRLRPGIAALSFLALTLAGCAPAQAPADTTPPSQASSPTPEAPAEPEVFDLAVGTSELGDIVVDSFGLTVYYFDDDTAGSGVSTCSGDCLVAWPAVHPVSDGDPVVDGVTGEVGVITGTDGKPQLTLNGLPLYYYIKDTTAGDVLGQAKAGVWWVVAPDGSRIG
jgi:predicted lipoprotein with Yx(FWY)xxD motif